MPGSVAAYRPAHQEPFGGIRKVWHGAMVRAGAAAVPTSGGLPGAPAPTLGRV